MNELCKKKRLMQNAIISHSWTRFVYALRCAERARWKHDRKSDNCPSPFSDFKPSDERLKPILAINYLLILVYLLPRLICDLLFLHRISLSFVRLWFMFFSTWVMSTSKSHRCLCLVSERDREKKRITKETAITDLISFFLFVLLFFLYIFFFNIQLELSPIQSVWHMIHVFLTNDL